MSIAEVLPASSAEVFEAIDEHVEQLDPRQLNKLEMRYGADCVVLPFALRENAVHLSASLTGSLEGESRSGDHSTTGLGRATIDIGRVINGVRDPRTLFDYGKLPEVEKTDEYGYRRQEAVLPPIERMHDTLKSAGLGESGKIVAQMLADIVEPYVKTEGDGYIQLPVRSAEDPYETGRDGNYSGNTAKLCSNTEYHFAISHNGFAEYSGLKELQVDGEVVALKKFTGDHTAILVKPAVLNGVRLPVGSIVMPGEDEDGNTTFAFGRLSAFVFDSPQDALREMPDVILREFVYTNNMGRLETAMERFNEKYKPSGHQTVAQKFAERLEARGFVTEWTGTHTVQKWGDTLKSLLNGVEDELDDAEIRQITGLLESIRRSAKSAAEISLAKTVVAENNHSQNNQSDSTQSWVNRIAQRKARLFKTFGKEKIAKTRELLDIKAYIEHYL